MKTPSILRLLAPVPVLALVLASCGNEPGPSSAPQPTETPSAAPAPVPAPAPEPAASATPSASALAAAQAPKPSQSSGRPMVLKSDPNEISDTFGSSPGAKLELGEGKDLATLRLPEGAMPTTSTVVTFKIEKSPKPTGGLVGKVYSIQCVQPPDQSPQQIAANGPLFTLELSTGGRKDVNLAIGVDDGKGRVKWTIVAPKSVDDARKVAIFELSTLPSGWVHATTKAAGK